MKATAAIREEEETTEAEEEDRKRNEVKDRKKGVYISFFDLSFLACMQVRADRRKPVVCAEHKRN